ncbi:MAG: TetR/AcrR family transcriptional regulator [Rhodocyclaceae bacterium]|nr:TetR/AcrR family transcriptional regulator [Rhodocyclaceae bacterium]
MESVASRRRGRPPRSFEGRLDTRQALLRAGVEVLTEKGFTATGLDEILRRLGVPKGSFYHYFPSKEAFGMAVIDAYAIYFARKLDRALLDASRPPLTRIEAFVEDAARGMRRHGFRRGCLVGNLGQEMNTLPESFRARLLAVFEDWQSRLRTCLECARVDGSLAGDADCDALAEFFWIGWEGAVLRAKLEQDDAPLRRFADGFFRTLPWGQTGSPN